MPELINDTSETCNFPNLCVDVGKFLELWTIWTALKEETPSADQSLSDRIWRTRQIGIFFAKINETWIFLIFIAPLSVTYDYELWNEEDFHFCVRENFGDRPYEWVAEDLPIQDLIGHYCKKLSEKGPSFLTHVLIDVLWGWERYFAQIRNDIRGVS